MDVTARPAIGPDLIDPPWTGGLWSLLLERDDLPTPMRRDTVFAGDQSYDVDEALVAAGLGLPGFP